MPILNISLEKFPAATEIIEALGFSQHHNDYTDLTMQTLLANNGGALSADVRGIDYATLPLVIDGKVSNEIANLVSEAGAKFVHNFLFDATLYIQRKTWVADHDEYKIKATYNLSGDPKDRLELELTIKLYRDFVPYHLRVLVRKKMADDPRITMLLLKN